MQYRQTKIIYLRPWQLLYSCCKNKPYFPTADHSIRKSKHKIKYNSHVTTLHMAIISCICFPVKQFCRFLSNYVEYFSMAGRQVSCHQPFFPFKAKKARKFRAFFAMLRLSPNLIISAEHKHSEQIKAVVVIPALAGTQGSVPEGF